MDCKKVVLLTLAILIYPFNAFCQLGFESKLYTCLEQSFHKNGLDLELSLDSLESQLYEIGYLSDSIGIYDLLRYQSIEGEVPLTIDKNIPTLDFSVNNYGNILPYCIENNQKDLENSKYGRISNKLNHLDRKVPIEIWRVMNEVLEKKDFQHPYYRFLALITLQSMSMDSPPDWYYDNVDTLKKISDKLIIIEVTANFIKLDGIIGTEKEIKLELFRLLRKYPKDHFIVIHLKDFMHNKRLYDIQSIISGSYYRARKEITANNSEIRHFEFLNAVPYRYRIKY